MLFLAFLVTGFALQPIARDHATCARAAIRAPSPACAIELPSQVKSALKDLELYDPTTMTKNDQDEVVGATAAGFLLVFLLPLFPTAIGTDIVLSAIVGGGATAYAALRKDNIGDTTRTVVGKNAILAAEKAKELDKEYKVTETIKAKIEQAFSELKKALPQAK